MLVAGELRSKTTVFEGDSLVAVRSVRHQGKGRPTYGVAVVDRAGVSHEVVRNVNELDAKRASEWLAGSDLDVAIDNPRYPLGMALAGGLILIGFGFALGALRRRRTLAAPPRDGSPPA